MGFLPRMGVLSHLTLLRMLRYILDTHSHADENGEALQSIPDGIEVENSYRGVHLTFPLTLNQLHKMVQAFRRKQVRSDKDLSLLNVHV